MKQQALQYFSQTDLTVLGMVLFLTVFMGVVVKVYAFSSAQDYEEVSRMPLKNDEFSKNEDLV